MSKRLIELMAASFKRIISKIRISFCGPHSKCWLGKTIAVRAETVCCVTVFGQGLCHERRVIVFDNLKD